MNRAGGRTTGLRTRSAVIGTTDAVFPTVATTVTAAPGTGAAIRRTAFAVFAAATLSVTAEIGRTHDLNRVAGLEAGAVKQIAAQPQIDAGSRRLGDEHQPLDQILNREAQEHVVDVVAGEVVAIALGSAERRCGVSHLGARTRRTVERGNGSANAISPVEQQRGGIDFGDIKPLRSHDRDL